MNTARPARLQLLPPDALPVIHFGELNGHELNQEPTAVFQIHCWMRDCPADLGRLVVTRWDEIGYEFWEYLSPRGFVKEPDQLLWRESRRRTKDRNPYGVSLGAHEHHGRDNWNADRPVRRREMPSETYGMDPGIPIYVHCHECKRTAYVDRIVSVTIEAGRAFLASR